MKHIFGNIEMHEVQKKIPLFDAAEIYENLLSLSEGKETTSFLFESRSINPLYGRMSLLGIDPILEIKGQDDTVLIEVKSNRGQIFFDAFLQSGIMEEVDAVVEQSNTKIVLSVKKEEGFLPENKRSMRKNTAQVLRKFMGLFHLKNDTSENCLLGLFGAFSYDFIRLFEELPEKLEKKNIPEFRFFLFDTFVRFDLIREKSEILCYRKSTEEAEKAINNIAEKINNHNSSFCKKNNNPPGFSASNITCDIGKEEYMKQVEIAKDLAERGETFEVVFSREFSGDFFGNPFEVYKIYREKNPAPYLFYFDFGENEYLVGASPEMMVRVEKGKVHLRPISGTRPRGKDPITDHEHELELLSCPKERAELDMLIDLGRNDLKRVCKSGIEVVAYRHVEKYSRVMHTIAHLTGKLQEGMTALDAIIACQSAGTLTGAPKVQAMMEIEKVEKSRRGYYGGSIGYMSFNGNMDTGIIIRSAHIQKGKFSFRVGATLLYDSHPEDEYKETENKAKALLDILQNNK